MRLILFDIDGTLLQCGVQIRPLFRASLLTTFGTVGALEKVSFSGKTDPQIVLELMEDEPFDREEVLGRLPSMRRDFAQRLEAGLEGEGMRLLPGVREVLRELEERADVALGLLTGNWERTGRIKLSRFDLNSFFPFGAFGDDGIARAELVPAALRRASRIHDRDFAAAETLLVGDSINDVECGRANGVPVLAVETGWTAAEELRGAGATWVLPDLLAARDVLAC